MIPDFQSAGTLHVSRLLLNNCRSSDIIHNGAFLRNMLQTLSAPGEVFFNLEILSWTSCKEIFINGSFNLTGGAGRGFSVGWTISSTLVKWFNSRFALSVFVEKYSPIGRDRDGCVPLMDLIVLHIFAEGVLLCSVDANSLQDSVFFFFIRNFTLASRGRSRDNISLKKNPHWSYFLGWQDNLWCFCIDENLFGLHRKPLSLLENIPTFSSESSPSVYLCKTALWWAYMKERVMGLSQVWGLEVWYQPSNLRVHYL